jgi:hypothetical protein
MLPPRSIIALKPLLYPSSEVENLVQRAFWLDALTILREIEPFELGSLFKCGFIKVKSIDIGVKFQGIS